MHYYATDAQVSSYFKYQFYCICIFSLLSPFPLLNTLKEVFQYSPHLWFFIASLYEHKIKTGVWKTADVSAERCQPVPFGRRWFCWRGLRGWLTGTLCCPGKLGWLTEACDPWVGGDWSFSLSQEPSLMPVGNEYILFGGRKTPNFQCLNLQARPVI